MKYFDMKNSQNLVDTLNKACQFLDSMTPLDSQIFLFNFSSLLTSQYVILLPRQTSYISVFGHILFQISF